MRARATASPVTVVMPSRSQAGCASRYARQTASSMSEPMSVSRSSFMADFPPLGLAGLAGNRQRSSSAGRRFRKALAGSDPVAQQQTGEQSGDDDEAEQVPAGRHG